MLYVSTRNKTDSYTAYWALNHDRTPDGGMYAPFQLPYYDPQQIENLKELSFGETVAKVLNQFFSARLTGWDVEFSIGRYPIKLVQMSHKVIIAEIWHNPGASFEYVLSHLYSRICGKELGSANPSLWARIAVYIAVLFGIYGEAARSGMSATDAVIPVDNPTAVLAAWYARKMSLPLGAIILACNDSDAVWDLVQKGTLNANAILSTFTEHLIYQTLGSEQLQISMREYSQRGMFQFTQEQLIVLNRGLYAVVAGGDRIRSVINSVYRTTGIIFDPMSALSYGCLQDYRSYTGESRSTFLIAENGPVCNVNEISSATSQPASELKKQMTIIKE